MESMLEGVHVTTSSNTVAFMGPVTPNMTQAAVDKLGPADAALPPKLMIRILDLEFVEMGELLPESWEVDPDPPSCCHHGCHQSH